MMVVIDVSTFAFDVENGVKGRGGLS